MDTFNNVTEYDRLNKVTKEQKRKLMELTEKGEKCLNMFKTPQYRSQKDWWWRKTSAILNSMPGLGAVKTAKQWEKTYKDIKMYARKKAVNVIIPPIETMNSAEANDRLYESSVELIGGNEGRETSMAEPTQFNGQEHAYSFSHTIQDGILAPGSHVTMSNTLVPTYVQDPYPTYYNVAPTPTSASPAEVLPELTPPTYKPSPCTNPERAPKVRQRRRMKRLPDVFPSHNTSLSEETLEECKTFLDNKTSILERIARAQEAQARVAVENAKTFETFVGLVGKLLDKTS